VQSALSRRFFEHRWLIATLAVAAAGLALRMGSLSEGYWFDEVVSAATARLSFRDLLFRSAFHDSHTPLYYLLLSGWLRLFGETETAARVLSLLLGMSTLGLVGVWAGRRGGWTSFMAVFLLAVSTFHIHYSVEVRGYGLVAFLVTVYLMLLERMDEDGRFGLAAWVLLGAIQCLAVLASGYTVPLVLAANIHFFTSRPRSSVRLLRWALVQAWSVAACSVWLPVLMVQWFRFPGEPVVGQSSLVALRDVLLYMGISTVHPSRIIAVVGTALPLGAVLLGMVTAIRRRSGPAERVKPDPDEPSLSVSARVQIAIGMLACLGGPLLAVLVIPTTDTTLPLLVGELARSYFLIIGALFLLLVGPMVNRGVLARGHGIAVLPFVLLATSLLLLALLLLHRPFHPRQVLFLLPGMAVMAAAAWQPEGMLGKASLTALVLALAGPSLTERGNAFEPRTDLRAAAEFVSGRLPTRSPDRPVFVIPMWDRPALEFYLGNDRAEGIMVPQRVTQASRSAVEVTLVLTREAFDEREAFRKSAGHLLGPRFQLKDSAQFRGVYVAVFVRSPRKGANP